MADNKDRSSGSSGKGKPTGKGSYGKSSGGHKGGSKSGGSPSGKRSSGGSKPYGKSSGGSKSYSKDDSKAYGASNKSGRSGSGNKQSGKKTHYSATTRDVAQQERDQKPERRRDLQGAAVNLPNWVIENLSRVTKPDRVAPALEALGEASEALGEGHYQNAVKHGERAKALSPNDSTVRETIGIAAYRLGDWSTALAELRAYRRMAGETTHLPIEMDILRAQGRDADVEKAWVELTKRGGHGLVMNEGIVVYGSYLLDHDRAKEAWKIVNPGRIEANPNEAHLRLYFVAGRVAAALGDRDTAKKFSNAIVLGDPGFPGWEQLESEIAGIGGGS
jgi:tetratricopeptide (TPR) repeat protein